MKERLVDTSTQKMTLDLEETIGLQKIHKAAMFLLEDFFLNMKRPSWWTNDIGGWETELGALRSGMMRD